MAFSHKDWKDDPDPSTPLSAEAIEDLEDRVTAPIAVIGETLELDTSGATDEASALQTAIDNIYTQGGGKINLPRTKTGYIKIGSRITVPQYVNLEGHGKWETQFRCSAAGAGLLFQGVGDTPSGSRGGLCKGFRVNGNQTANICIESHAVNRNFTDIRFDNPKAAGGIGLKHYGSQNNNHFGCEGEDQYHTGSSSVQGIVFDGGAAGHNFFGTSLNEFTNGHIVLDATGHPAALATDYCQNISFYGNMIERTDTGSPILWVKSGQKILFDGGTFSMGTDFTPNAEYPMVLLDQTASRSLANGGSSPTRAINFRGIDFFGAMNGSTRYANVIDCASNLSSWHDAAHFDAACKYSNCKYLAMIRSGAVTVRAEYPADSSGGGLSGFSNPSGAGKINTRVQSASGTIAAKSTIDTYELSGSTTITSVSGTHSGHKITLLLTGTAQVTDGSNLKLNGNFTGSADRTLSLVYDGSNWQETGRSAN